MWVAKIKLQEEDSLFGSRTRKYGIDISGYPLSYSLKEESLIVYAAVQMFGPDDRLKKFVADLQEAPEIINLEQQGHFLILRIKRDPFFRVFYDTHLIYIKPIFINSKGENFFEIGSFSREELTQFTDLTEKEYGAQLLSIHETEVLGLSIISPYPAITQKQREVFELALREGYYSLPRKIDVLSLAKKLDLSFSTCRSHLRKAESKLLPFVFNFFKK